MKMLTKEKSMSRKRWHSILGMSLGLSIAMTSGFVFLNVGYLLCYVPGLLVLVMGALLVRQEYRDWRGAVKALALVAGTGIVLIPLMLVEPYILDLATVLFRSGGFYTLIAGLGEIGMMMYITSLITTALAGVIFTATTELALQKIFAQLPRVGESAGGK